jgi:hypothetical protein
MLNFFQKAYLPQYIALLILAAIFWAPSFFLSKTFEPGQFLIFENIVPAAFQNVLVLNGLAFLLTILTGLFINNIAGEVDISKKLTTITMFIFVVITGSLTTFTTLSPYIITNILLLFFLWSLFRLPASDHPISLVLNASLILGISSLFYPPIILFLILVWIALLIHRSNSWRYFIVSIIGILLPHFFLIFWYFWNDDVGKYLMFLADFQEIIMINNLLSITLDLILVLVFFLLYFISLIRTMSLLTNKNINLRRNLIITIYFILFALTIFVLFSRSHTVFLITAIPGTLLITHFLQEVKAKRTFNLALLVLLVVILINQFTGLVSTLFNLAV